LDESIFFPVLIKKKDFVIILAISAKSSYTIFVYFLKNKTLCKFYVKLKKIILHKIILKSHFYIIYVFTYYYIFTLLMIPIKIYTITQIMYFSPTQVRNKTW